MNEYTTIDDIYEKSNLSDIDICIENTISLKLMRKNYSSAIKILGNSIGKLLDKMINITKLQLEECKENNQNNIITMTRYIDFSKKAYDDLEKKNQEFIGGVSSVENIRSNYAEYIHVSPVTSICINYNSNTSSYTIVYNGITYNIGPCKFSIIKESKNNNEIVMTHKYIQFLLSKLYNGDINDYIIELLQFGSCIILKALNNKKLIVH